MLNRLKALFSPEKRGAKQAAAKGREKWDLGSRFSEVYENRLWLSEESVSGSGSERESGAVLHSVQFLARLTRELGIRSVADIPCGDFNWMPMFLDQHPDIAYVGYDVVPALIAENRAKYPGHRFELLDITLGAPEQADLIFSKDMFNHLNTQDIWAALENMAASKPKYLMLTTNKGFENTELEPTEPHASRFLNLEVAPFFLPAPLIDDHYLPVWRFEDVERRLAEYRAGRG